ncbi:MAG: PAS domain S-box protein [Ignavibacteria bacterium]|nr:PAS domain S-box protein [Ignavibacteria bacterium]
MSSRTFQSSFSSQRDKVAQLEKQLAWYRAFFENAADAVFIVQPETWSVLDANEYASVLTGIPRTQLLGTSLPQFRRIFKLLTKSSSPTILSELSLDSPHNENLMVEVSARFVTYDGQRLIQANARDVSEQRALTDRMVQADKMVLLGQLSAGVAHEIRNPLAAINLNLQVLQRKIAPETADAVYVQTAIQGVERIAKIVEATLDFSRPAVTNVQVEDVNLLIRSSLELTRSTFSRKTISINVSLAEDLPQVALDAKQIQQVLINLLTNAADAIRAKGQITIQSYRELITRRGDQFVVIAVTDTGIGISEDDLTKIFNPFFTRKAEGTGLGLPITQRIIHQHSGSIDVESTIGIGTTFYVKLPVPQSEIRPAPLLERKASKII